MADYDDYDSEQYDDLPPGDLRRQLKEAKAEARQAKVQAQEAETLRAQVQRLERDGTIRDAGLTLNDQQRAALQAVHGGEWNADAIKQTATTLGFYSPPTPQPVVDDPNLATHEQIAAAAAGTDAPPASRDAEIDAQLAQTKSAEEYLAAYRASGRPIAQ